MVMAGQQSELQLWLSSRFCYNLDSNLLLLARAHLCQGRRAASLPAQKVEEVVGYAGHRRLPASQLP